jgi:hypothetical protein
MRRNVEGVGVPITEEMLYVHVKFIRFAVPGVNKGILGATLGPTPPPPLRVLNPSDTTDVDTPEAFEATDSK